MAVASYNQAYKPLAGEELATLYVGDLLYRTMVEAGDSVRLGELAQTANLPPADLKLLRVVLLADRKRFMIDELNTNTRTTMRDRRWTLSTRYLDTRHTIDRNIATILKAAGKPVALSHLARELSLAYHRPADIYQ